MRSWRSQPTSSTLQSLAPSPEEAEWIIAEADITICRREDGSEFLLGKGAFGKVRRRCGLCGCQAVLGAWQRGGLGVMAAEAVEQGWGLEWLQVYKAMLGKVEPVAMKLLGGEAEEAASAEAQQRAIRELKLLRDCRNPHM